MLTTIEQRRQLYLKYLRFLQVLTTFSVQAQKRQHLKANCATERKICPCCTRLKTYFAKLLSDSMSNALKNPGRCFECLADDVHYTEDGILIVQRSRPNSLCTAAHSSRVHFKNIQFRHYHYCLQTCFLGVHL